MEGRTQLLRSFAALLLCVPLLSACPTHVVGKAPAIYSLVAVIDRLQPQFNVVVTHVGIDDAELGALLDMNTSGPLPEMSKNRQGELDALTSQRFRDALKARNVRLLTYRDLIAIQGLKSMRRPAPEG